MSANSEVSIAVWDEFSQISLQSAVPLSLPNAALSIDFRPLIMDNFGLLEEELTSTEFSNALSGSTRSVDYKEYTWDWAVWGILDIKKEEELHVKVFNVSHDRPHWETTVTDVLQTSKVALNANPFKGVTDILLLGKMSSMSVLVWNDEADETSWILRKKIGCGAVVIELGIGVPVRVNCPNYQGKLPKKIVVIHVPHWSCTLIVKAWQSC